MVNEHVPKDVRLSLLGKFIAEDMAGTLDDYYVHVYGRNDHQADESARRLEDILTDVRRRRVRAQRIGALSFLPFVGLLVWHAVDHNVPLFAASFAGFALASFAVWSIPKMRRLAFREAKHEFAEYLFLIPLFFSITLLQKTGFFQQISSLLQAGIERMGASHLAFSQFAGTTLLSAILDNNVVADFAGRSLHGLGTSLIHFFAMAQIAGYAVGGCWTHIGSAQSVVAYSYIRREVDARFTPFQWIKAMTPVVLEISLFVTAVVYVVGWLSG
jgi:di/tricarboxylate transporter